MMKVAIVEYINALPFRQGLEKSGVDIISAIPSKCARLLHQEEVDMALIPIGALQTDVNYHLIEEFGIGCTNTVQTVALFGHQPLENWNKVYLDYHSRTSAKLTQILMTKYFNKTVQYQATTKDFNWEIQENEGMLMIGDKVFERAHKFEYKYDLGEAWYDFTSLPMVFAVWASLRPISIEQRNILRKNFTEAIHGFKPELQGLSQYKDYFENQIDYLFCDKHIKGLKKFLYLNHLDIKWNKI